MQCNRLNRAARAGALSMSGLPPDFDPMSPSLDHLSVIDKASKSRAEPRVSELACLYTHTPCAPCFLEDVTPRLGIRNVRRRDVTAMKGGANEVGGSPKFLRRIRVRVR